MAQKWDFKKRVYNDYNLPEGCYLYTSNLENEVACAECGKKVKYGDCFTSKSIHNHFGLGFPVCEDCYQEEIKKDLANNK